MTTRRQAPNSTSAAPTAAPTPAPSPTTTPVPAPVATELLHALLTALGAEGAAVSRLRVVDDAPHAMTPELAVEASRGPADDESGAEDSDDDGRDPYDTRPVVRAILGSLTKARADVLVSRSRVLLSLTLARFEGEAVGEGAIEGAVSDLVDDPTGDWCHATAIFAAMLCCTPGELCRPVDALVFGRHDVIAAKECLAGAHREAHAHASQGAP